MLPNHRIHVSSKKRRTKLIRKSSRRRPRRGVWEWSPGPAPSGGSQPSWALREDGLEHRPADRLDRRHDSLPRSLASDRTRDGDPAASSDTLGRRTVPTRAIIARDPGPVHSGCPAIVSRDRSRIPPPSGIVGRPTAGFQRDRSGRAAAPRNESAHGSQWTPVKTDFSTPTPPVPHEPVPGQAAPDPARYDAGGRPGPLIMSGTASGAKER